MLAPTSITETALYVDDLERSIRFYTGLLGCPVVRRDERFCALRIAPSQVLLLFRRGASSQPIPLGFGVVPPHDGTGRLHVCFGIHQADLEQWERQLARHGVSLESRIPWPVGSVSLYFRDPDGHAIELATPGLWD
jgi:catechol 2,3-dioxygenase-like lactoylglutathione lyase family enzyme